MKRVQGLLVLLLVLWSSAALASESGGHGFSLKVHGFYLLNFIVFVWLIVKFTKKPFKETLAKRSDDFQFRVAEARAEVTEARELLDVATRKAERAEVEGQDLKKRLEEDGVALKARIIERGQAEALKLERSAQMSLESEKKRISARLEREIALGALDAAEATLVARKGTLPQDAFVGQFVSGVAAESHEGAQS